MQAFTQYVLYQKFHNKLALFLWDSFLITHSNPVFFLISYKVSGWTPSRLLSGSFHGPVISVLWVSVFVNVCYLPLVGACIFVCLIYCLSFFLALSFMWSSCWADILAVPCPVWALVWEALAGTWKGRACHSQVFVSTSLGWPQLGLGEAVRAISSLCCPLVFFWDSCLCPFFSIIISFLCYDSCVSQSRIFAWQLTGWVLPSQVESVTTVYHSGCECLSQTESFRVNSELVWYQSSASHQEFG